MQEYAQRRNVIQEDVEEAIESLVRMIENVFQFGMTTLVQQFVSSEPMTPLI